MKFKNFILAMIISLVATLNFSYAAPVKNSDVGDNKSERRRHSNRTCVESKIM